MRSWNRKSRWNQMSLTQDGARTRRAFIRLCARLANIASMAVASLIVAIVAIVIALASAVFTRRQASAAEESLRIERRRRHEERRPRLTGKVDSPDGGDSYQLRITLDADSCQLTRMEVSIREGYGVALRGGFSSAMSGLLPGGTAHWPVDVADKHESAVWVDATCYAEGKDEGEDHWTVPIEVPVTPRLMNTIR
jgi:hypothetical protein